MYIMMHQKLGQFKAYRGLFLEKEEYLSLHVGSMDTEWTAEQ